MHILFGILRIIFILIGTIAFFLLIFGTNVFITFIIKKLKSNNFISKFKKYLKNNKENKILKLMDKELRNEKNNDFLADKFNQLKKTNYKHDFIIRILRKYSKNKNVELKTHAAGLLEKSGIPILLDIINTSLKNSSSNYKAFKYLDKMEEKYEHQIIDGYIKILKSENLKIDENYEDNNISKVLDKLIYKNYDKTKKILLEFFNSNKKVFNKSVYINWTFLNFFKFHKIKDHYNWVLKQINNDNIYVKESAISCIGKIGDIKAFKILYPLLKSKKTPRKIKQEIVKTIKKIQKDIPITNKGHLALVEEFDEGKLTIKENNNGKLSIKR